MGFWDFLMGGFRKSADDEYEAPEERKTYGDLFVGGAGRNDQRGQRENDAEAEEERPDPKFERKMDRMGEELRDVERRARDMRVFNEPVRKSMGKIGRDMNKLREADNPLRASRMRAEARSHIEKGYRRISEEHEKKVAEYARKGLDRKVKEEKLKLNKTREEMSKMYRDAGGSGMLH